VQFSSIVSVHMEHKYKDKLLLETTPAAPAAAAASDPPDPAVTVADPQGLIIVCPFSSANLAKNVKSSEFINLIWLACFNKDLCFAYFMLTKMPCVNKSLCY
jgi:hypothetical protein